MTAGADGNWFVGNNFSANVAGQGWDAGAFNRWDNVSTGNIWGDYVGGTDADDDLAGSPAYNVDGPVGAKDNYPFCDDGNDIGPVFLSTGLSSFYGGAAPSFVLAIREPYGISEKWLSYNGGLSNHSCGIAGSLPQWITLANGTYTVMFWANDSDNYVGYTSVLIHKDIFAPVITISSPVEGTSFSEVPLFSITVEDTQLDKQWYTIGNDATKHHFSGLTFTLDPEIWAIVPSGEITIHVYANDTLGDLGTMPITIIKTITGDLGWLWFVLIGGIIGVVLIVVIRRKLTRR